MRYKIYGNDLLSEAPFVRKLTLTDDMTPEDILNIIGKFWGSANSFYHKHIKGEEQKQKPTLTLGSDKDGCLTLFSRFAFDSNVATLKRVGVLLPETHPLFNFSVISIRINRFVRSGPVSGINFRYFLNQIENFI